MFYCNILRFFYIESDFIFFIKGYFCFLINVLFFFNYLFFIEKNIVIWVLVMKLEIIYVRIYEIYLDI